MTHPSADTGLTRDDLVAIEAKTVEIGQEIFAQRHVQRPMPWQRRWWDEQMMDWAMVDEGIKVQMFRFVDVLPTLRSSASVVEHLQQYFREVSDRMPRTARVGLWAASPNSLAGKTLAKAARSGAQNQARRFIAGTNLPEVLAAAGHERTLMRTFTLDILGEAVTSDSEAERYFGAYSDLIEGVAPVVNEWPEIAQIDRDDRGPLPRTNVSVKLSALDSQADEIDPIGSAERISSRLRQLLRLAGRLRAFVNIDMESYHLKDLTLQIFKQTLMEQEFRQVTDVGIVIQCYLRDAQRDLIDLRDWARARGTPVWVRIVKGAYWDHETIHASYQDWPVPVFQQKWESDANFERQARFLLENGDDLRPAVASHNIRSLAHTLAVADYLGLPKSRLELQMLYGMADGVKRVLTDMGYRLRTYMPYGELIPGMAYLVRRLLENTSNDSFLRASLDEQEDPENLLVNPMTLDNSNETAESHAPNVDDESPASMPFWKTYRNEPPSDFAKEENRQAMRDALDFVSKQLGRKYPLTIDGQAVKTAEQIESLDPSQTQRIVGKVASATAEHAEQAVAAAGKAGPAWSAVGAEQRGELLRKLAQAMRDRRPE